MQPSTEPIVRPKQRFYVTRFRNWLGIYQYSVADRETGFTVGCFPARTTRSQAQRDADTCNDHPERVSY